MKRKLDEDNAALESAEDSKKKGAKEIESLQSQLEEAIAAMEKLDKTKHRLQGEVKNTQEYRRFNNFESKLLRVDSS